MNILKVLAVLPIVLTGCGAVKKAGMEADVEKNIWLNSYKVDCAGVAPMSCWQYQEGESFQYDGWMNLYQGIEGFEYRPGNIYKLRVRVEQLNQANLPADASSIRYHLVKVLETKPDPTLRLNDIWVLEKLEGQVFVVGENANRPQMEINVAQRRVGGKAPCNNFFGSITLKNEHAIEFGKMGSTMMACPELDQERKMLKTFDVIRTWKIENNRLILTDEKNMEVMVFCKVD